MRKILISSVAALLLAGCAGTGGTANLGPLPTQTIINIGCTASAVAPGFIRAGTAIAAIVDPTTVDQLAQVNEAEALAHVAVQDACKHAIPGGVPATVTPVSVPLPVPLPPTPTP